MATNVDYRIVSFSQQPTSPFASVTLRVIWTARDGTPNDTTFTLTLVQLIALAQSDQRVKAILFDTLQRVVRLQLGVDD